jgi:translation initiation factor IF-3
VDPVHVKRDLRIFKYIKNEIYSMEIQGKLHKKYDTQQVSEKFAKREFVVIYSDNPLHPQFVKFECTQDRCGMVDALNEGDEVKVVFNLRGREYVSPQGEKKYFTSLEAWKIDKVAGDPNAKAEPRSIEQLSEASGDLPF